MSEISHHREVAFISSLRVFRVVRVPSSKSQEIGHGLHGGNASHSEDSGMVIDHFQMEAFG